LIESILDQWLSCFVRFWIRFLGILKIYYLPGKLEGFIPHWRPLRLGRILVLAKEQERDS
jgi:hypothetical protein